MPPEVFRCVTCGAPITTFGPAWSCGAGHTFPVVEGVPRLIPEDSAASGTRTARTFGFQWTRFDVSERVEDTRVFAEKVGLPPSALAGKLVLDAGCGGGRYARLAGEAGAEVVALDLSAAVEHARRVTADLPNVTVVQGNLFAPPLRPETFDVVYSIGVLHHTPRTRTAFDALAKLVKPGGHLAVWLYRRNTPPQEAFNTALRAVTTRLPVGAVLWLARAGALVGGLPIVKHLNKIVNFSSHHRWSTRVCDTFDWYAPPYQWHHTEEELASWFAEAGFIDVRQLHPSRAARGAYRLVYRGNFLIGSGVNVAGRRKPC